VSFSPPAKHLAVDVHARCRALLVTLHPLGAKQSGAAEVLADAHGFATTQLTEHPSDELNFEFRVLYAQLIEFMLVSGFRAEANASLAAGGWFRCLSCLAGALCGAVGASTRRWS